eukprot:766555-Hanusia_phi.AAC.7
MQHFHQLFRARLILPVFPMHGGQEQAGASEKKEEDQGEGGWEDAVGAYDKQADQVESEPYAATEPHHGKGRSKDLTVAIHNIPDSDAINVFPSPLPSEHPPDDLLFDSIPLSHGLVKLFISELSAGCRAILMLIREEGVAADVKEVDIMRGETHTSDFGRLNAKNDVGGRWSSS